MFGNYNSIIFIGLLFCFMGCAKPHYADMRPVASENGKNADQNLNCHLQLQKTNFCVELNWDKFPTNEDYGAFKLSFYRKEAPSVWQDPEYDVQVLLWMPKMGHGSSPVKVSKSAEGVYLVEEVYFIMPGLWQIRIQLKENQNVVDEIYQDYNY